MSGKLCDFEIEVLRVMNGEDAPGMVAGAGMWTACAFLKSCGYAEGHYTITQKGRDFLAGLQALKEKE